MVDLSSLKNDIEYLKNCLADLQQKGNARRVSAYWNIVTFGRMVTFHLQKLLKHVDGFTEWYSIRQSEMRNDPLLKFFSSARNELEKERLPTLNQVTYISRLELPKDLSRFGTPPPNNKGFFVGDNLGGSGWFVAGPDGNDFKVYVELPDDIGKTWMSVKDLPESHLGVILTESSVESICGLYVNYLEKLVQEATIEFK